MNKNSIYFDTAVACGRLDSMNDFILKYPYMRSEERRVGKECM